MLFYIKVDITNVIFAKDFYTRNVLFETDKERFNAIKGCNIFHFNFTSKFVFAFKVTILWNNKSVKNLAT